MPGRLVSAEAGREVLRPVAALGQLPLVDEVDAGLTLPVAHLADGSREPLVADVEATPDVVGRGQGADVGGENPVRASSHDVTPASS